MKAVKLPKSSQKVSNYRYQFDQAEKLKPRFSAQKNQTEVQGIIHLASRESVNRDL